MSNVIVRNIIDLTENALWTSKVEAEFLFFSIFLLDYRLSTSPLSQKLWLEWFNK